MARARTSTTPRSLSIIWTASLLIACGDDGGATADAADAADTADGSDAPSQDPVAQSLANLNVDTAATPRVDGDDQPLPDSYTPLGKRRTLAKHSEIFLAGPGLGAADDYVNLVELEPGVSNVPGTPDSPARIRELPADPLDAAWKNSAYNAAAACDVDGDGLDEMVLLWWTATDDGVRVATIDDETGGFAASDESVLTTVPSPSWLELACGDLDGDGVDQIVVAIADDTARDVTLAFLTGSSANGYAIDGPSGETFAATQEASRLGIDLALGQLDHDGGLELGVVINEVWGSGTNGAPANGRSEYYLYDDGAAGASALLTSGRIAADVAGDTHNGLTGAIAMGDVDGDGLDEVVLAALTGDFPVHCEPIVVIQLALDHAIHSFASLGAHLSSTRRNDQGSGCETSGNNGHIAHVMVGTADVDGDQRREVHVNGEIYDDFATAGPWEPLLVDVGDDEPVPARVPNAWLYKTGGGNNQWAQLTRENVAMAVGDVTSDGMADILVVSPGRVPIGVQTSGSSTTLVYGYAMTVWGIDPLTGRWGRGDLPAPGDGHVGLLYAEELTGIGSPTAPGGPPIVATPNVDEDSTTLAFSEGSHRLVFSEPIVHAALAAPPCYDDGTQVSADCRTSWGTGTTTGVSASISHEISVKHHTGVTGGVSLPVVGDVGVEVEQTVGVSLKAEASLGYELTRTVTYTTGPMEDTVIATVIPYDQYTYEILSHPVYPQLAGQTMIISLPRTPRTMQLNRAFYNDSLVGDGVRIDDSVFSHTIGDPASYPSRSRMTATSGALHIGPQDVGASGGNQSVSISESKVAGFAATVGVTFETTVKATGGAVMSGYTVSDTTEASLGFSVGSEVTFTGTVGDMPPATFSLERAYAFGMFVYTQSVGDAQRPFQVVNYWVE